MSIQEYVPLETLVANWSKAKSLNSHIRRSGILTQVTLYRHDVPQSRLAVNIYFQNGKLHNLSIYANVTRLDHARDIDALTEAAERIIERHEYHEAMKAGDE